MWHRDGSEELCQKLHRAGVPVLVLSAGMGDVLEQVLRHFKVYTDNVKVVSNFFKYNEQVRNFALFIVFCNFQLLHFISMFSKLFSSLE